MLESAGRASARDPAEGSRMEGMRSKIFSVDEANRLIPYLEETLDRLASMSREASALKGALDVLSIIESGGASEASPDVRALREQERAYSATVERIRAGLRDVSQRGCLVRDLELGLVDFYTMARDQVVCLCWRRGEPRVEHWHPVDEGFSGRRPLADLA
jgi:hypothetical protein